MLELIVLVAIGLLNCTVMVASAATFVLPAAGVMATMESGAAAVVNEDVTSAASVLPFASATPPLPPETVRV